MIASTHSSGTTFESELESFVDEKHNLWNLLHHTCTPVFQRRLPDEDAHFVLDVLTIGNVHMARVRRWSGARS